MDGDNFSELRSILFLNVLILLCLGKQCPYLSYKNVVKILVSSLSSTLESHKSITMIINRV